MNVAFKRACFIAGFLLLSACQSAPQAELLRKRAMASLPESHTIANVPFYPQQDFYCGPTTLAEVFGYYGRALTPDEIAPKLFIPGREGSLQLEMVSATRQFGFLPYAERGTLTTLIELVSDDIPVIVFQNLSIQLLPQWHYAVVIGFNKENGSLILHTGVTKNHEMSLELFEKTWARAGYWFLSPLSSDRNSKSLNAFTYTSAAYDMLKVGQNESGISFLEAATQHWPEQWLSYFLLGNHFMNTNTNKALYWFAAGYEVGKFEYAFAHNYIYTLIEAEKMSEANLLLKDALTRFPDDPALLVLAKRIAL